MTGSRTERGCSQIFADGKKSRAERFPAGELTIDVQGIYLVGEGHERAADGVAHVQIDVGNDPEGGWGR